MAAQVLMNGTREISDYDYIIRLIQYLDTRHNLHFFISSRDFDVLYRWWEKRIPLPLVERSLSEVVGRFVQRGRAVRGFSSFGYEVRKQYRSFLTMRTGTAGREEAKEEFADVEIFLNALPPELSLLRTDFERVYAAIKAGQPAAAEPLQEKLLQMFGDDPELKAKKELFLSQLAAKLRTPEIERKYILNYLFNKFRIPFQFQS